MQQFLNKAQNFQQDFTLDHSRRCSTLLRNVTTLPFYNHTQVFIHVCANACMFNFLPSCEYTSCRIRREY